MPTHQIIIADDHPLVLGALSLAVSKRYPDSQISTLGSLGELVAEIVDGAEPDLVLLDLSMPGMHGLSGLAYLRAQFPEVPIVIVSASDASWLIRRAVKLGASGYIPKSEPMAVMHEALGCVLEGELWVPDAVNLEVEDDGEIDQLIQRLLTLTPQQVRVLMMLQDGMLNKQIAYELGISEATVKAHVSGILHKFEVASRTMVVIAASRIAEMEPPTD